MPPEEFELAVPANKQPQTHALDGAATGTGIWNIVYVACPENFRTYRIKIFQSYLEATQPCRLQSTPLYSVCTAASVSSMFWSIPGKLF
jgi:hypothetical protein